jgi:hypothetical protein
MKEKLRKNELLKGFSLSAGDVTIRLWTRQDLDTLAAWPDYPFPYLVMEITSAE